MRKRIVILTTSAKPTRDGGYGYCVAGVSLEPNGGFKWIRLVEDRDGNAIPVSNFDFKPLDVIDADVFPCPIGIQKENYTFSNLKKYGTAKQHILQTIYDKLPHSFFGNMNKSIDGPVNYSLSMIIAKNIDLYREDNGNGSQKADFSIGNNRAVGIAMTDFTEDYRFNTQKGENEHKKIDRAFLVVSLPKEPVFNKFIAKIFPF